MIMAPVHPRRRFFDLLHCGGCWLYVCVCSCGWWYSEYAHLCIMEEDVGFSISSIGTGWAGIIRFHKSRFTYENEEEAVRLLWNSLVLYVRISAGI